MDTASDPFDADGDGYDGSGPNPEDCDDSDALIFPGAQDVPYDGQDQDCDGEDLVDVDGDGLDGAPAGGEDCEDGDPSIPRDEDCEVFGDEDCDGEADEGCPELADPANPGGLAWTCAVQPDAGGTFILWLLLLPLLVRRGPTSFRR